MNIGIFTDAYYPQISGVVTSTILLKNELQKFGHNVTIITVSHPEADTNETDVIRLPSIPFVLLPSQRVGTIYSHKVMNRIRKLNLDVIHTQTEFSLGLFGRIVAKKLGVPVVHTYHTMYEDYMHYVSKGPMLKPASKFAKKVSKLYCKDCSVIIAPTMKVKEALLNYGVKNEIKIIPTGIDLDPFKKSNYEEKTVNEMKRELGIGVEEPVVLFIGRVAKEKSIDIVIKNMVELRRKIPNVKLLIIGDGPERKNLESLSKNLGLDDSTIFAGEKPWNEIGKYYQLGDVFVSASTTETQGLTFTEAMAAEIPVVAKYDKNLDGIITNEINGRIFNEDDELSEVLFEILNDEYKASKIVKKALKDIEPLSSKHFAEHVEKVYFGVVKEQFIAQYS